MNLSKHTPNLSGMVKGGKKNDEDDVGVYDKREKWEKRWQNKRNTSISLYSDSWQILPLG